jgi:hypothetical protein
MIVEDDESRLDENHSPNNTEEIRSILHLTSTCTSGILNAT